MQCRINKKNSGELILIVLSASEKNNLEWENSNEFRLDGKMYDVAFKKKDGIKLYLYCYNDSREEHLFASLKKHIKNYIDCSAAQKDSKTVLKSPVSYFYTASELLKILCNECTFKVKDRNFFSLEKIFIEFPSPPPKQG